jgi:hypothetical protein
MANHPDTRELIRIVEHSELEIWRRRWTSIDTETMQAFGIDWRYLGYCSAMITDKVPAWFFNRIMGFGLNSPVTQDQLASVIEIYREKLLPVAISLSPFTAPY